MQTHPTNAELMRHRGRASNEPDGALQYLAEQYISSRRKQNLSHSKLLSGWWEYLQHHAPHTLDLPVMQLIRAFVRADLQTAEPHIASEQATALVAV